MSRTDRKPHHPQLWLGYALIIGVIVLAVTAINTQFQYQSMRRVDARQTADISRLNADKAIHAARLQDLQQTAHQQGMSIAIQRSDLERQQQAIRQLSRLRNADAHVLLGLRDELAATHASDAQIRQRLVQLESSNAAARAALRGAGETGQGKP